MTARRWLTAALMAAALASPAMAHDLRPAYLELIERGAGRIELLWKEPLLGDTSLGIVPVLPESCRDVEPPRPSSFPARASSAEWSIVARQVRTAGRFALMACRAR